MKVKKKKDKLNYQNCQGSRHLELVLTQLMKTLGNALFIIFQGKLTKQILFMYHVFYLILSTNYINYCINYRKFRNLQKTKIRKQKSSIVPLFMDKRPIHLVYI